MAYGPLGISLGIDFSKFDQDMVEVANRIESAGKNLSIDLGSSGEAVDLSRVMPGVGEFGMRITAGIAAGIRTASASITGFGARAEQMLDRLAGASVTMFRRIDASMKFPIFDAFLTSAQLKLGNFITWSQKPLTDLDLAIGGAFGSLVERMARVLKALIDSLAASIAGALKQAVASVVTEFTGLAGGIGRAEASARALLDDTTRIAAAATAFPKFFGAQTGLRSTVPGPRIGAREQLTVPPTPTYGFGDIRRAPPPMSWDEFRDAVLAAGRALSLVGGITARVGAALVYVPLSGYAAWRRLSNFFSTLGDVAGKTYSDLYSGHGLIVGSALAAIKAVTGLGRAILGLPFRVFRGGSKDAAEFATQTRQAQTSVQQLSGAFRSIATQVAAGLGIAGAGYAVVQFFRNGIKGASDLNEAVSRSQVVFGSAFGAVEAQANQMTRAFGLSRKEQMDIASGFGAMAQGAGMSEEASAKLANQLTKMAADLSSSVNIPMQEAGEKIRAALAGEAEPLRQFGVNMLETNVQAYALANGMATSAKAINDLTKIQARAALIMQGLSYAQNDLQRTSDSAANQFRKAGGGLQEFGIRIGQLLLPAINLGTQAFNTFLATVLDVFDAAGPYLESFAAGVAATMERVGFYVRNLGVLWQIAQLRVGAFVVNAIAWIETLPLNFGPIIDWLRNNWWNMLMDLLNGLRAFGTNLLTNAVNLGKALWEALKTGQLEFTWTPLLDGFKAQTEQLPELIKPALVNVDDEVKRLWDEVERKEAARKAALEKPGAAPKPPGALPGAGKEEKEKDYKIGGALEVGSKEAFSAISRGIAGRTATSALQKSVSLQQQIEKNTREQVELARKGPAAPAFQVK